MCRMGGAQAIPIKLTTTRSQAPAWEQEKHFYLTNSLSSLTLAIPNFMGQ